MKTSIKKQAKFVSVLLITLLTFGIAKAQPGGQQGPPPVPNSKQIEKMVKELDTELSLSDEQETKVSKLYIAHFDEVKSKMSGNQRPSREEMETLESGFEKEVKTLLDKDQKKLYSTWLKKQKQKSSSQRPQGGQGPRR